MNPNRRTHAAIAAPSPSGPKLNRADRTLFRGTAAEVHPWMSNQGILRSIGCDFEVIRRPAESYGRSYGDCQLWLRSDNQDLLGFFGCRRQVIQPATFLDYFRSFCDASDKQISLDVIGSYNNGRTLFMGAKLTNTTNPLLQGLSAEAAANAGLAISNPRSSLYIPTEERTDHWLLLTDSFGESLRPRVLVVANELICSNGLARKVNDCEFKLSHTKAMTHDTVNAVLGHALRSCRAYERIKQRLIATPISMDSARSALRQFFDDADGSSKTVQRLEQIHERELIGSEIDTRHANAWRLASAVTQYTSHERLGRNDVAFRSQLEGSRARTANRFLEFLEDQFLRRHELE